MVQTDEERKAKAKARAQLPENKAKRNAHSREYDSRPENKAKAKARSKEYNSRPEIKAKAKARYLSKQTPEHIVNRKDWQKKNRLKRRLNVLQTYSKRLSNSDIPCCNCCGENFHIDFLAIDHIAGRQQMDSEPELIKLGYSSELSGYDLKNWLIKNDFPEGFQILCHNCNSAKKYTENNNECPMKNKSH